MVFLKLFLVGLCFFALPQGIQAKEKAKLLGYGLLFTNDFFGDGRDRWRTGSLVSSRFFGSPKMNRTLPRREALNELRLFSQIIAPSDLSRNPDRSHARDEAGLTEDIDRDYVGHLSIGLHRHFQAGGLAYNFGVDASLLGPQTGLMGLQQKVHSEIDQPFPSDFVKNTQVSNQFILGILTEVARPSALSPSTNIRSFVEVQTGVEDLIRIGVDAGFFGDLSEALFARAPVSGQRHSVIAGTGEGFLLSAGVDLTRVIGSMFLTGSALRASKYRARARFGLNYVHGRWSNFIGWTYLSPEFERQQTGQLLGSFFIKARF